LQKITGGSISPARCFGSIVRSWSLPLSR
jgi:hypothetical protein